MMLQMRNQELDTKESRRVPRKGMNKVWMLKKKRTRTQADTCANEEEEGHRAQERENVEQK